MAFCLVSLQNKSNDAPSKCPNYVLWDKIPPKPGNGPVAPASMGTRMRSKNLTFVNESFAKQKKAFVYYPFIE